LCFGLCSKTKVFGGFNMINDCEILELWKYCTIIKLERQFL
jgi:hypothetical protein